jgi:hypothetical protein
MMKKETIRVILGALVCSSLLLPQTSRAEAKAKAKAEAKVTALGFQLATSTTNGGAQALKLLGAGERRQLLVNAKLDDGSLLDHTRDVSFSVTPENVVRVTRDGRVIPLGDGNATITAKSKSGLSVKLPLSVEDFDRVRPINFSNQIVPIFTKLGCNGGGCHGKSGGQNGFRLSLLGFEPPEDYEYLVKESRGRRIFTAAPERSLLLLKAEAALPHGGGKRLDADSDDYRLLVRWIKQGMPFGEPDDPKVAGIEVFPKKRTMLLKGEQQLAVVAHYTDGTVEDVTRSALYEPNDKELAETAENGRVTVFDRPGDVAVMVRYQAQVAVFQATVPLGAPVENLPEPNNYIDELIFKKLKTVGMPPSDLSDDATFLRRVTIDIAGRLPSMEESKAFLADKTADKRDKWIDKLLAGGDYADYFANKWGALLRNKRTTAAHANGTYAFHGWIRDSLHQNKPYDQFVREVVAASGEIENNPPVAWYRQVNNPTAQLEDSAQLFLGMRLQCAQCHHHPFEKWSQKDYYSFSAFFSRVGKRGGARPTEEMIFHRRGKASAKNKKNNESVLPAGLGAEPLNVPPDQDPRHALVDWMSASDNPFFAKALVNRYWKHFFGRGLVDPEDDMRETNPPTNPELLDALAKDFVASGFDLKRLVKTITQSKTYQLSAMPNEHNAVDKHNFARFYPRRLTAETLLDAINEVADHKTVFAGLERGSRAVQLPDNSYNDSVFFLKIFGRPDSSSSCECERSDDASLAQSLHLINSKGIQDKLTNAKGRAAALAADKDRKDEDKIRDLYHMVYSRGPDAEEVKIALNHLAKLAKDKAGKALAADVAKRQAYEDILLALINTKEFLFNH